MPNAVRVFDPTTPTELQVQDWTCSIRSVMWMLKSIGIPVTPAEAQDAMSPQYVNSDLGLLDASGAGIVKVLRDHWGIEAVHNGDVSFDDVKSIAGTMPVALGLRSWGDPGFGLGHWSAVREMNDAGEIVLANPGGTGPIYGQQTLSRQQFDARGPASLVAIPVDTVSDPAPVTTLRGIDVASHQHPNGAPIDWGQVAASGIAFAGIKLTGGLTYANPYRAADWADSKRAGLIRLAYHYAFESTVDPLPAPADLMARADAEADVFCAALESFGLETGDLLALDIEDGDGSLGDWCLRWLRRVENRTGIKPMCYTGKWFSIPHGLGSVPALAAFPLWLAQYQATPPTAPLPWSAVTIHQHSATGVVPGIVGDVDINNFFGTRQDLLTLGKPGTVTPPVWAQPGDVGDGLLRLMAEHGDVPALPSTFLPLGRSPATIEECTGFPSGAIFRWHLPTGRSWVYEPAA